MRTLGLTLLTMAAFAANSVLCRVALAGGAIDAATFSTIRIASGALMLVAVVAMTGGASRCARGGGWWSGTLLALYAVPFSFAYLGLGTGTGALLLFGAVQITMIAAAIAGGERPSPLVWSGFGLAGVGLYVLLAPGLAGPPIGAALLMLAAGVAWGFYSLRGRGAGDPVATIAASFVRAAPLALAVSLVALAWPGALHLTPRGCVVAIVSGAITSGLGYVVWYRVLPRLTTTGAATVQLSVPVLAALGGVLFIAEAITPRLVVSSLMILGGVGLSLRLRAAGGPPAPRPSSAGDP